MATIEPKPLSLERRAEIEAEHSNCPPAACGPRALLAALLHAETMARAYFDEYQLSEQCVVSLEQREAHVIEVLREAQRNNGGYGFVRGLLEYLGAAEVE